MFKGLIKVIKAVGNVKAKLEAADDDVNLNGVPEYQDCKNSFTAAVDLGKTAKPHVLAVFEIGKKMLPHLQEVFVSALRLVDHVAKAGG